MEEKGGQNTHALLEDFIGFTKGHFDTLEKYMDSFAKQMMLMTNQFEIVGKEIKDIKENQNQLDKRLTEVQKTVQAIAIAVDADSLKVVDHEARITKLEEATA